MLFQKPLAKGDIVSVRLVNGEEIVGRYSDANEKTIRLGKPVVIMTQMVSETQAQLGFAPFMSSVDEELPVPFALAAISAGPLPTKPDVSTMYRRMTSSIAVPERQGGLIT